MSFDLWDGHRATFDWLVLLCRHGNPNDSYLGLVVKRVCKKIHRLTLKSRTSPQDFSSGLEAPAGLGMMTLIFHLKEDGHNLLSTSVIYTGMCGMNKSDREREIKRL